MGSPVASSKKNFVRIRWTQTLFVWWCKKFDCFLQRIKLQSRDIADPPDCSIIRMIIYNRRGTLQEHRLATGITLINRVVWQNIATCWSFRKESISRPGFWNSMTKLLNDSIWVRPRRLETCLEVVIAHRHRRWSQKMWKCIAMGVLILDIC